ncbi:hypothetical protein C8R41DRAFT_913745 [Lentinula lateritia]|uniref:BTB domain-containing protein n=1 Tax=Lentinula lateritia TaxID=40482 RepID=A0ABQ8VXV1_9AGAR|nr:hypothetical protein C8R41DRAFT_913745 [Lentinula lateritia]
MPPKCGVSENCSLTVDVILQSSDGEQLGAHSKNLELFTDAFPVAGSTLPPHDGEVVKLTESAEILRLVLSYTHNTPPPDLGSLDLDTLLLLGEVVIKKYGMHLAGECVNKEVNLRIPYSAPLKILAYKTRVSDFSLIDETAQKTMDDPLEDALSILDPIVFRVWIQYREKWQKLVLQYQGLLSKVAQHFMEPRGTTQRLHEHSNDDIQKD